MYVFRWLQEVQQAMENSIAQVIESYLALVPDRRKTQGIVHE